MNKLTIEFTETGMRWGTENPASFEMLARVGLQFLQMLTLDAIEKYPDTRGSLYDMLNNGFTNVLNDVDPDAANHPNLTEVAILLAENTLLTQAQARGMTLDEYLPEAKIIQEREFELFKQNESGRRRHIQKAKAQRSKSNLLVLPKKR